MANVLQGKRPERPSHDLSRIRGLSDDVWNIIVTCWAQDPTQRYTVEQVLEQLQASNQPVDQRPPDDFSVNPLSQTMYRHIDHPFSALAAAHPMHLLSMDGAP